MKSNLPSKEVSKLCFLLFISFLFTSPLISQIEVEPTGALFSPESLITNVFLGEGVEVTNLTYSGTDDAVGYFTNGQNDVGIGRGIVMSSGQATTAAMSDMGGGTTGTTSGPSTDPYLNDVATLPLNDLARYTITFIPISDTLRFRYSFASEEYPEYACSGFNDVFGFFIQGPGINGAFTNNAENIALIPELGDPTGLTFTDLPVTINNVNSGVVGANGTASNCEPPNGSLAFGAYYNDNIGSATLTYDGILDVFTAQAIVTPCEEYTIVLAIADVSDGAFDSAVFLEAKSFGTGSLEVETATVSLDGTITEGCSDGVLSFTLPSAVEDDLLIDYTIFGTAQNGVDYEFIPGDLTIPAGSNSVSVPVIAFEDGLAEGIESIGVDVQRDPCNRDTFFFFIRDNNIVPPNLREDTTICQGQSVQLDGTLPVPLPDPPTFENTTDYPIAHIFDNNPPPPGTLPTIAPLQVFGVQPPILAEGVIKRVCVDVDHKWISDVDIFLVSPGGQFMELTTDNGAGGDHYTQACFTPVATDTINFGSQAPKEAAPFTGDWYPEGVWSDLWDGDNPTNGIWQLQIKDDAMGFDGTLLNWSICFNPIYQIEYRWQPIAGLSCADCPDPIATPDATTTYVLVATDTYGCSVTDSVTIEVIDELAAPDVVCGNITTNSINFEWTPLGGAMSYEVNVDNMGWQPASGSLSHLVSGLSLGQNVTIEVRGLSDCDGAIGTVTCMVPNCTAPTSSLINFSNVSCAGGTDGTLLVEGAGANAPFEYELNGVSNMTGAFASLAAGDYNIIITNTLGCSSSILVNIGEPVEIQSQGLLINDASCNGGADGSITVEVNGGSQPYNFDWNLALPDSIQNGLPAGMYYVTITDASGCSTVDSVNVAEPALLSLSTQVNSISCNGQMDGTAAVVIDGGGTGPFNFLWDNNANNQIDSLATELPAGTYFITVTDNLGCTQSTAAQVFENAAIDLNIDATPADCNGTATGTATVAANGGAGSFIYLWDDASMQTTPTATSLPAGMTTVTVTDIDGCSETISINITEPAPIDIVDQVNPISCFGANNGEVVLTISGGAYPYTYSWSDDISAVDSLRNDLSPGAVQVTVTDNNGCSNLVDLFISEPSAIALTPTMTAVSCNGGTDGSVSVAALGGMGMHSYLWDVNGEITSTVTGLTAGTYFVTVSDENNCSSITSIEITEPQAISLTTQVNAICNGASNGSAMVLPIGGTAPYNFQWDANANNQVTQEATNLVAGNYVVTVTDMANCTEIISADIFESPAIDLSIAATDLSCNAAGDGTTTVTPMGGTPPFNFQWSDANNQNTATAIDLDAGTYTVTVSDLGACTQEISVTVAEPNAINITEQSTAVSCFGSTDGGAILEVNGGVYPYTYTWSDNAVATDSTRIDLAGGPVTVTITDNNGCSNTVDLNIGEPSAIQLLTDNEPVGCNGGIDGTATVLPNGGSGNYIYQWGPLANDQTTQTASNLPSGTFAVTVTDDQGCSSSITVDVLQATSINIDANTDDVICFGANDGSIALDVDGGNGPYTYQWEGPNNFSSNAETLNDLYAGTYFVTIIDNNNCSSLDDFEITQPTSTISSTMSTPDTICNGFNNGTAAVAAIGGTGTLSYQWSFNNVSTASISDLPAGEHYVTITDAQGCSWLDTALVIERPAISIQLSQDGPLCFNGTDGVARIDAIVEGSNTIDVNTYTYNWDNGQTDLNASQLVGGQTYTVVVTAPNGCTASESIVIANPNEIGAVVNSVSPVNCNNGSDGEVSVSGAGGTLPYTYLWNDALAQDSSVASNLFAGEYIVTITDANGCFTSVPVSVEAPNAMSVDFNVTDVLCPGDANGKITALLNGGTAPYSYEWSSGDRTNEVDSIFAGVYSLTITDDNGCTLVSSETIVAPDPLRADLSYEALTCHDSRDGRINIEPMGGKAPYRYSMNGVDYDGSPVRIALTAGDYDIHLVDANGCTWNNSINIPNPPALEVNPGDALRMELGDSLQLSAEVFNNVGDFQIDWTAPYDGTLQCIPDTIADCERPWTHTQNSITYTVYATDENGCEAEADIYVEVVKPRPIHVPTAFTPNQDNNNDLLLIHGKPGSKVLTFQVFDRWGELVFQSGNPNGQLEVNDETLGWDGNFRGQAMNTGIYIWHAEVEFIDGRRESFNGNTTLLR